MVMPFGVKNGPPTFQRVVSRTFREYLDQFMKIFLDDFIIYNDTDNHLMKLKLCFHKCKEYKINLNLDKCAFMVFLGFILRFIVSKEGKIPNLKKVQAILNMPIPTKPQQIQVLNGMAQFYKCFIKLYLYHGANHQVDEENGTLYLDHLVSKNLGLDKVEVHGSTNYNTSKLAIGVSCAHKCIVVGNRCNVGKEPNQ